MTRAALPSNTGALALAGLKAYIAREERGKPNLIAVTSGAQIRIFTVCAMCRRRKRKWARATEGIFAVTIPKEEIAAASLSLSIYWEIGIATSSTERTTKTMKKRISRGQSSRPQDLAVIGNGWMRPGLPNVDLTDGELPKSISVIWLEGGRTKYRKRAFGQF